MRTPSIQRTLLVRADQPAIAGDVGRQNGRKAPLDAPRRGFALQLGLLKSRRHGTSSLPSAAPWDAAIRVSGSLADRV